MPGIRGMFLARVVYRDAEYLIWGQSEDDVVKRHVCNIIGQNPNLKFDPEKDLAFPVSIEQLDAAKADVAERFPDKQQIPTEWLLARQALQVEG